MEPTAQDTRRHGVFKRAQTETDEEACHPEVMDGRIERESEIRKHDQQGRHRKDDLRIELIEQNAGRYRTDHASDVDKRDIEGNIRNLHAEMVGNGAIAQTRGRKDDSDSGQQGEHHGYNNRDMAPGESLASDFLRHISSLYPRLLA